MARRAQSVGASHHHVNDLAPVLEQAVKQRPGNTRLTRDQLDRRTAKTMDLCGNMDTYQTAATSTTTTGTSSHAAPVAGSWTELKRQAESASAVSIQLSGPAFDSTNVIAEIPGGELADEVVVVGAHLDSWGLGTGAPLFPHCYMVRAVTREQCPSKIETAICIRGRPYYMLRPAPIMCNLILPAI